MSTPTASVYFLSEFVCLPAIGPPKDNILNLFYSDYDLNAVCQETCIEEALECIMSCDSTDSTCISACLRAEDNCVTSKNFENYNAGLKWAIVILNFIQAAPVTSTVPMVAMVVPIQFANARLVYCQFY